jgi:diguanylate cyclase (GGDEF)-like protein
LAERLKVTVGVNVVTVVLRKEGQDIYDVFSCGIERARAENLLTHKEFNALVRLHERAILDSNAPSDRYSFLLQAFEIKKALINPLYLREQVVGFLLAGNYSDALSFNDDDLETIELFARNISIVREHEQLVKRVEDLEMFDPLTRVYNERFFFSRLNEEINRASTYQRPCGFLNLEIANYSEYHENFGLIELERILKEIVRIFREHIKPIDILGRIKDNRIGAILIERNKRQTHYAGEKIQEAVLAFLKDIDRDIVPDIKFAVAENPIDGTTGEQLSEHIESQLKKQ